MAYDGFFSAGKFYGESSPGVESSRGESCGFQWRGAGGGVRTRKGIADGGTDIIMESDHFFIGDFTQLSLKKKNVPASDSEEVVRPFEADVQEGRKGHRHHLRSCVDEVLFDSLGFSGLKVETLDFEVY